MNALHPDPQARPSPALRHTWATAATIIAATAAALLLTTLGGCASPGPQAEAAKLAGAERLGLTDAATPALAQDWWTAYGDTQLDALVARALADQPTLRVAQARLARVQASVAALRGEEAPQVGLSGDVTRQRYTANGLYPAPLAGNTYNSGNLSLGLAWDLDLWGRQRAAVAAAVGSERAAQAEAGAVRQALATQVVRGYVQLARLIGQREVAERALAQRGEMLGLIRQRVAAGLDTRVELRQGEGALPDNRAALEALDEQITLQRHQLAALTAQPVQALAALRPALTGLRLPGVPEGLGTDLLARRPDVVAARWRVEAAQQDVAQARAQFYPDVRLSAFVGLSAIGLDRLLESDSRNLGAGPALHLPLFDGGRLRAQLQGRSADRDVAIEQYNQTVLDAVREAADALASVQSVQRQQAEQAQALAAAEAAWELARQRYGAGLGNYLIVLSAETQVLVQRRSAVDLAARALDARAALMKSLGGGWSNPWATADTPAAATPRA